jgi:hypothetical protein
VVQKVVGGSKGGEVERVGGKIDDAAADLGVDVDAGTDSFVLGTRSDKGVEGQEEEEQGVGGMKKVELLRRARLGKPVFGGEQ